MKRYLNQYIDGAWVESDGGSRHQVINPATEQPCTEITFGTAADVDKAVTAARRAFESFSQTSVDTRVALLEAIIAEYKNRSQDIAEAIAMEMGRSEEHTSELQSLMRISYAVFCLKKNRNKHD